MTDPFRSDPRDRIAGLIQVGKINDASRLCLETLASNPDDPDLLLLLANCEQRQGNSASALERLQHCLSAWPDHAPSRLELAKQLMLLERHQEARAQLQQLLERNPNHAPARTLLARLENQHGRFDIALEGLRTALRADPDHLPAHLGLVQLLLDKGQLENANQHISHALSLAPDDWHVQVMAARVFEARDHAGFAEQCLKNAIKQAPGETEPPLLLGRLLQRAGRHAEALEWLQRAEQCGGHPNILNPWRAVSLFRLGRMEEARDALESILDSYPQRSLLFQLGELYQYLQDVEALRGLAAKAGRDNIGISRWLLAQADALAGRLGAALSNLDELESIADAELESRAVLLRAAIQVRQQQFGEVDALLRPFSTRSDLEHALGWEAARLCRLAGNLDLGIAFLDQLLAQKSIDEDVRNRTATMRLDLADRAGRFVENVRQFGQSAWQAPYLGDPGCLQDQDPRRLPDLSPLDSLDWLMNADAVRGPRPVFLCGWPCTGRELLLALARCAPAHPLPLNDWSRRREALQLPMPLTRLTQLDPARLRSMARRYLRGNYSDPDAIVVETAAVTPQDLIHIARVFPRAAVLVMRAEEKYLELQWRLAGYRQVPTMLRFWRRDERLLERLEKRLPVEFIDLATSELLDDPGQVLSDLCNRLQLLYDSAMPAVVGQLADLRGYRSPEHWKNYFPETDH